MKKRRKTTVKNRKLYLKLVAMLLSLVMLIFSSSLGAFAVEDSNVALPADNGGTDNFSDPIEIENAEELSYLESQSFISSERIGNVIELTDRREENVKHFSLPDGTVEAVVYPKPVHRKDASGVWQDINNNLISSNNGKYGTADGRISFSQASPSLTISENGYTVSMEYAENESPSLGNIESTDTVTYIPSVINAPSRDIKYDTLEEAQKINNKSILTYTSNKGKIEYILNGNNVKENIIINSPLSSYEYIFKLTLGNLTAVLSDNGDILLNDGEDTKYIIPAPFMYDAEGNISYDAEYELMEVKEGLYLILLTASSEWINHEDRVFPVTLDPSINSNRDIVFDSFVSSVEAEKNTNYGYLDYLALGEKKTVYIYAYPPQLPSNITVNTATLNVYNYYDGYEGSLTARVYEVTEYWSETEITHNDQPIRENTPLATVSMTAEREYSIYNARQTTVSIKSLVTNWLSQSSTVGYYGFAFVYQSGTIGSSGHISLISSESSMDMGAMISINYYYDLIDGVYAFKNQGASNRWMTVEMASGQDIPPVGANLQQKYSSTSPANEDIFDRTSLFKITKVAEATATESARYVIRSMLDNTTSFAMLVNGTVVAKRIPLEDENVDEEDTFYIEAVNNRYFRIIPYEGYNETYPEKSKVITVVNTSTADLNVAEKGSASTKANWELYRYTGVARTEVTNVACSPSWTDTGIVAGSTGTMTAESRWSTYPNAGELYIELHSGYSDMGDFTWNENTGLGTFVAENFGTVRFVCKIPYGTGQTANVVSYDFQIVPQAGTYYIQNVETEKYIDVEGPSTVAGADIQQWHYHGGNQSKWNIEHVSESGGYVRMKSVHSNLYIGVNSSNTSQIKQYATQNDYTLWKIDRSSTGNLIFRCKATESSNKVLTVPSTAVSDGDDLTQATYNGSDSNFMDEWYIVTKVLSLVNYYDLHFSGYPGLIENIPQAVSYANMVYSRYYNVGIYMDGAATYRHTRIDECEQISNAPCTDECSFQDPDKPTNHTCYNKHHKNVYSIYEELYDAPRESYHVYVLWTNRMKGTFCGEEEEGGHELVETLGLVYNNHPVIHMMTILGDNYEEKLVCMSLVLVHEISHTIKMDDVSDAPGHDIDEKTACIMEEYDRFSANAFLADVQTNSQKPFCNSCNEAMKSYTSNIVIHGNQEE